jgi:hypothetical protein
LKSEVLHMKGRERKQKRREMQGIRVVERAI